MMEIPRPALPEGHPDRLLHCEEMLEAAFLKLADRAVVEGWNPDEVALALQSLADGFLLAREGNVETETAIALTGKTASH